MSNPVVALDVRLASGNSTGDSTYWIGLLRGLAQLSPELDFLLVSNAPRPAMIPDHPRFTWIEVKSSSRWFSLVRFPLLSRRLKAGAIHTQYNLSPLAGHRGITTIHDVSFLIEPRWFKPRDRFILTKFVSESARRAAKVITVSQTSKAEIERLIPVAKSKTVSIYNACPDEITRVDRSQAREFIQEKCGLDGPFALTVGTRWPRKNMNLAIQAVDLLPAESLLRLAVTGKPGWGGETPSTRVVATGFVDWQTLSALYSAAHAYLAPSHHEGFGIPVLEAFRTGCPVIASQGGALPEVVGPAGIVVNSWEPANWAQAIIDLLADSSKMEQLRKAGFEREKSFTWKRSAEHHADVYREVIDARSKTS